MTQIQERLFELRDEKYRDFQSKLIPNIRKETVIGVRTPLIKALAKELYGSEEAKKFLASLPHRYFDENQLHSFLISVEKDFRKCVYEVEKFLPYIDNWATCDQLSPKCFYSHSDELESIIPHWINSNHAYTVRFGIGAYMRYFLDDKFALEYAERVASIKSDEYYINMMIAWYFATALVKQWDHIFPFIEKKILPLWVHNKTIQKAIESYRISQEKKEILRNLKR